MRRLRSGHFIIHLMALWWVLWLGIAMTPLNIFLMPSWEVAAQFGTFVLCFVLGHALARLQGQAGAQLGRPGAQPLAFDLRFSLHAVNLFCLGLLLLSLQLSGAFSEGFIEYFAKLRLDETSGDSLTGSRLLDVATKAIAFPASYTITIVVLATRIGPRRWALAVAVTNMLLFSYLWQVNYSVIHLFWFFVFYLLTGVARGAPLDRKMLIFVVSLVSLLVAVAANRFGGDVMGGVQRYVFGYHTAGFSFYDHHYRNAASLLHEHSFGRSSLGFMEQLLEIVSRRIDLGFVAASSENANYNNESIDLGATEIIPGNAFGTFLYGFYRDFHLVGIVAGGLLYGWISTRLLARSRQSWVSAATFYVLATSWMVGMMVNPIEQAYFWFAILFIGALSILNRGFKW